MSQYFNQIDSVVQTNEKMFNGILGLTEQVSTDLFLTSGVYSLWALDAADPIEDKKAPGKNMYANYPFYMGQAANDGVTPSDWFGVYTNLAAA